MTKSTYNTVTGLTFSTSNTNNTRIIHWPLMGGLLPNVTAHLSTASVPITVLLYDGSLLCGFNSFSADVDRSRHMGFNAVVDKSRHLGVSAVTCSSRR